MLSNQLVYLCPRCGWPETAEEHRGPNRHIPGSAECDESAGKNQFHLPLVEVSDSFVADDLTVAAPPAPFDQTAALPQPDVASASLPLQGSTTLPGGEQQAPVYLCPRCYHRETMEEHHGPNGHITGSRECTRKIHYYNKFFSNPPDADESPIHVPPDLDPMLIEEEKPVIGATGNPDAGPVDLPGNHTPAFVGPALTGPAPAEPAPTDSPGASALSGDTQDESSSVASAVSTAALLARYPDIRLGQIIYMQTKRMAEVVPKSRREHATVLPYRAQSDLLAALEVLKDQPDEKVRTMLRAHRMGGNMESNVRIIARYLLQPFKDAFPSGQNPKNVQKAAHRMVSVIEYIVNIWKFQHEIEKTKSSIPSLY